jgi:hypothetical protein
VQLQYVSNFSLYVSPLPWHLNCGLSDRVFDGHKNHKKIKITIHNVGTATTCELDIESLVGIEENNKIRKIQTKSFAEVSDSTVPNTRMNSVLKNGFFGACLSRDRSVRREPYGLKLHKWEPVKRT